MGVGRRRRGLRRGLALWACAVGLRCGLALWAYVGGLAAGLAPGASFGRIRRSRRGIRRNPAKSAPKVKKRAESQEALPKEGLQSRLSVP